VKPFLLWLISVKTSWERRT